MKEKLSVATRVARKIILGLWAVIIIACLASYFADPASFSAVNIAAFIERFGTAIWLVYLVFSILRGFTLLPSTPLVIAGSMLFPYKPWSVLAVSMSGILMSSAMIYYLSEFLGFSDYFERHSPDVVHRIKARLEHPLGFLFVAAWAFFPFVPTDLVCYAAGTTKMAFPRFITAIGVGECILCSFYIFSGSYLLNFQ